MRLQSKYIFVFLISFIFVTHVVYSQNKPEKPATLDFKWESIDWATAYEVEIKDIMGKIVLKKKVTENRIDFNLPSGLYRIRIGAYDRFDKLAAWSDWQKTEIRKKVAEKRTTLNLGIKVSVGMSYVQYLSSWDIPFDNTFNAYMGKFGFIFGDFILFQPSKKVKYMGFLRYLGMEVEGSFVQYKGKKTSSRPVTDMAGKYIGGNLFFITNFNFPLNIIVRAGGGAAESEFTYYIQPEKTTISSNDPYFKGGVSLEFSFLRYFFLEAGVDYFVTSYIDFQFKSIRYYGMLGLRL